MARNPHDPNRNLASIHSVHQCKLKGKTPSSTTKQLTLLALSFILLGHPLSILTSHITGITHTYLTTTNRLAYSICIICSFIISYKSKFSVLRFFILSFIVIFAIFSFSKYQTYGNPTVSIYKYFGLYIFCAVIPTLIPGQRSLSSLGKNLQKWLTPALLIATPAFYISFQKYFTGNYRHELWYSDETLTNPLEIAYFSSFSAVFLFHRITIKSKGSPYNLASIPVIAIAILTIVQSGSRGPLLAFLACAATSLFFKKPILSVILVAIAIASIASPVLSNFESAGVQRIFSTTESVSNLEESRLLIWIEAIQSFVENPFYGGPLVNPNNGLYPHNSIIEALVVSGAIGGIVFITLILICSKKAITLIIAQDNSSIFAILFFHYLIYSQFSSTLYMNTPLWALISIILLGTNGMRTTVTKPTFQNAS